MDTVVLCVYAAGVLICLGKIHHEGGIDGFRRLCGSGHVVTRIDREWGRRIADVMVVAAMVLAALLWPVAVGQAIGMWLRRRL